MGIEPMSPIQFILQIILRIASMIREIFTKFCFEDMGPSVQAFLDAIFA